MFRPERCASLLLIVLLLLGSGCFRVTYRSAVRRPSEVKVTHRHAFWIVGLVGEMNVRPEADCQGRGVARMASGLTVVDSLLTIVTIGIYAPRTVVVTCAQ
jgi:hypothetical protein